MFISAPYVDHSNLCDSGRGRFGALLLRHRAEQVASVGDDSEPVEKLASSEATKSTAAYLFRLGDARNRQAPYGRRRERAVSGPAVIGVRIAPGWMELTRMLRRDDLPVARVVWPASGYARAEPRRRADWRLGGATSASTPSTPVLSHPDDGRPTRRRSRRRP